MGVTFEPLQPLHSTRVDVEGEFVVITFTAVGGVEVAKVRLTPQDANWLVGGIITAATVATLNRHHMKKEE